ncbi:MAG TPA: TonB-dependent receptor, partial [Steroidobacteraceae bacterium]
RYEFPVMDYGAFVQGTAIHRGHMFSTTDKLQTDPTDNSSIAYDLPAYTSYDASAGINKDAWSVQLYAENLTDARGITFATFAQRIREDTVIRPRTISIKVGYKFQ